MGLMIYNFVYDVEIGICIKSFENKATSDVAVNPLKYVGREILPVTHELVCSSLAQGI